MSSVSIRVAGFGQRSGDSIVRLCRTGNPVVFVPDGRDRLRVFVEHTRGVDPVHVGYVPTPSAANLRTAIVASVAEPGFVGATVSSIGRPELLGGDGYGFRVSVRFATPPPRLFIQCDCCEAGCPTLEFEGAGYRD